MQQAINRTNFHALLNDNSKYAEECGQTLEEYHLVSFDNYPEGWNGIFYGDSWDLLSDDEKTERRSILVQELSEYAQISKII